MRFRTGILTTAVATVVSMIIMLVLFGMMSSKLLDQNKASINRGIQLAKTIDTTRQAQIEFQRQVQEWKNTLLRGSNPEQRTKYWRSFEKNEAAMDNSLKSLITLLNDQSLAAQAKQAQSILAEHAVLGEKYRSAIVSYDSIIPLSAIPQIDAAVKGMDRPTSSGIDKLVDGISAISISDMEVKSDENIKSSQRTSSSLMAISFLMALFLAVFLIVLYKKIYKSLGGEPEDVILEARYIAEGDLTRKYQDVTPNSLMSSISTMQRKLLNITEGIQMSLTQLDNTAKKLKDPNEKFTILEGISRLGKAAARLKTSSTKEG